MDAYSEILGIKIKAIAKPDYYKPFYDCGSEFPKEFFRYIDEIIRVDGEFYKIYTGKKNK